MREVRPGTFLINAKGKKVRVTNVYFSRESTVMLQIFAHCTRRRNDTYRATPMDAPSYQSLDPQASQYLHSSSPQNLRKSGDMWGFSTENN